MSDSETRGRVIDIPIEAEQEDLVHRAMLANEAAIASPSAHQRWWIDVVSIVLLGFSMIASLSFWRAWFETYDAILFVVFAFGGLTIAIVRSNFMHEPSLTRSSLGTVILIFGVLLTLASMVSVRPKIGVIACSMIPVGWALLRSQGEKATYGLGLAVPWIVPLLFDELRQEGYLDWVEPTAVSMTPRIADLLKIANAPEGHRIVFQQGAANEFSGWGTWDSPLGVLGLSIGVIVALRRNLVVAILSMGMSLAVWLAVRTAAWIWIATWAAQQNDWTTWTLLIGLGAYVATIVLYMMVEQFLSTILEPIHEQYMVVEYPLLTMAWNWVFGLPQLVVRLPMREQNLVPLDTDTEL